MSGNVSLSGKIQMKHQNFKQRKTSYIYVQKISEKNKKILRKRFIPTCRVIQEILCKEHVFDVNHATNADF